MTSTTELRMRRSSSSGDGISRPSGLTAQALIIAKPAFHGVVHKLHVPTMYFLLPSCLQRLLASQFMSALRLYPRWADRHLVLLGKFLYRFIDDQAYSPKGSPLKVNEINVHICERNDDGDMDCFDFIFDHLPPDCSSVFAVQRFNKKQYYAVGTKEEATCWVNSIREARQAEITRSMGHASHVPYPKSWDYYDTLGNRLAGGKERIRKRLLESNNKQMDVSSLDFGGSVGPIPRGYYG